MFFSYIKPHTISIVIRLDYLFCGKTPTKLSDVSANGR